MGISVRPWSSVVINAAATTAVDAGTTITVPSTPRQLMLLNYCEGTDNEVKRCRLNR
jgi:hypothetical protein